MRQLYFVCLLLVATWCCDDAVVADGGVIPTIPPACGAPGRTCNGKGARRIVDNFPTCVCIPGYISDGPGCTATGSVPCGSPCGDCDEGTWTCPGGGTDPSCQRPHETVDLVHGLTPVATGARAVFDPDTYPGTDRDRFNAASVAAGAVNGAVVMHRIYEPYYTVYFYPNVLYTGGGLKRACHPVAYTIAPAVVGATEVYIDDTSDVTAPIPMIANSGSGYRQTISSLSVDSVDHGTGKLGLRYALTVDIPTGTRVAVTSMIAQSITLYAGGIIVDSVLFDGNFRCNPITSDWRYSNTYAMNGTNIMRNNVFYDTPSENVVICGGTFENNIGFELQGSLTHKSCSAVHPSEPFDYLINNYTWRTNLGTDAAMEHSEGCFTESANAGHLRLSGNKYLNGREGVFGQAGPDDEDVVAVGDCYAHYKRLILLYGGADPTKFDFSASTVIDVPQQP
jgi:hypothetical protein